MRNVFVERWPSLVKVVLAAGAVIFAIIRWPEQEPFDLCQARPGSTMETEHCAQLCRYFGSVPIYRHFNLGSRIPSC